MLPISTWRINCWFHQNKCFRKNRRHPIPDFPAIVDKAITRRFLKAIYSLFLALGIQSIPRLPGGTREQALIQRLGQTPQFVNRKLDINNKYSYAAKCSEQRSHIFNFIEMITAMVRFIWEIYDILRTSAQMSMNIVYKPLCICHML